MKNNRIECQVKVNYILFPKGGYSLEPGTYLVFKAVIGKVISDKENILKEFGTDILCAGVAPTIEQGKDYYLCAELTEHKKYGKQFKIVCMNESKTYNTPEEKRIFLSCILSGDKVKKLYKYLKDPFETIQSGDIKSMCQIPGIKEKTAQSIIEKFNKGDNSGSAALSFYEMGIDKNTVKKLSDIYHGADVALFKIKENPYTLIKDVQGYGWKRADSIALKIGFGKFSIQRIGGYILHCLSVEAENGNSWVESTKVINSVRYELGVTDEYRTCVKEAFANLISSGALWTSPNKKYIALSRVRNLEKKIAVELARLYSAPTMESNEDIEAGIEQAEEELGFEYTDEQKQAIKDIVDNNVCILTGYGGTGKSSVVAGVLKVLKGKSYAQCALSGRAAARMQEITEQDGFTIHRLLGYKEKSGFEYNATNQLELDTVILDETSMVGADLFWRLIQSIKTGSRFIMIGDDGQLESIGECNIFKDMLKSGLIPTARLTKIHRQAAKSAIITDSIRVRNAVQLTSFGWVGTQVRGELKDLELDIYSSSSDSYSHVMSQFKKTYKDCGYNADKIQIVLPQKTRGSICTLKINRAVQEIVNPYDGQDSVLVGLAGGENDTSYTLRVGDSVIINKNNYNTRRPDGTECPVYNGNKGKIISIDNVGYDNEKKMIIDFDQWGEVVVPKKIEEMNVWNTVELAYALTCHKLQGSEAENVIIGMDNSARIMLTREWLYTAITRAKKHCVLCAETKALNYAISTSKVPMKQTFLVGFIKENFQKFYA